MGKTKRAKANKHAPKPYSKPNVKASSDLKTKWRKDNTTKNVAFKSQAAQLQQQPVPFKSTDKILLVGEGDFSFSASLVAQHGCTDLTATTFEPRQELLSKYPQAEDHLKVLEEQTVLFAIDATKLGLPHVPGAAQLRKSPRFDIVVFNFPHVGGKSTDVNRQVRANQELVVKFLEGAKRVLKPGGAVILTIFEGQPYELWGVRNLVRHVGLQVERSFKFVPTQYLGYQHVRTLGNVERGWKGEDRDARMYIVRTQGNKIPSEPQQPKSVESSEDDSD